MKKRFMREKHAPLSPEDVGSLARRQQKHLGLEKTAEPPPPKGVSVKVWDRILSGKIKKAAVQLTPAESTLLSRAGRLIPAALSYKYIYGPMIRKGQLAHARTMQAVREGWPASWAAE
jgi:hypothetical protein